MDLASVSLLAFAALAVLIGGVFRRTLRTREPATDDAEIERMAGIFKIEAEGEAKWLAAAKGIDGQEARGIAAEALLLAAGRMMGVER